MSSRGAVFGIQNPDRESRLFIEEYNDETLRFRDVAHVCEVDPMRLMRIRGQGLCRMSAPKRHLVKGAVSYPTARSGVARLRNAETPAYLAYRDLRLDTLLRAGGRGGLLGGGRRDPSPAPVGGGGEQTGHGFGDQRACDCTCSARPRHPSARCKLLCGKQWKNC